MSTSTMFRDDRKKAAMLDWYHRFRAKAPVPAEEATVATSFGKTHALLAGPAGAPPLVVLHGALATSAHVLPELGPLLRTRRVVALDVIGQSVMSEDRRLDLDDDSYGRRVAEATRALGLERYDLYGASWGGFVALRAARAAPERLDRLVLLVPAGLVGNRFWPAMREMGWPLLLYRAFPSEARLARVVRALFSTPDPDWTAYFGEALRAYRLDVRIPPLARPGDLAGVTCPTLVFGGDLDVHFPGRALIARVKELVPHAEGEVLEGSRHCPPFSDDFRDRIGARIERFLGGAARAHFEISGSR
jgi:pimeloyl-ACP methyl ester carboxylesterase